MVSRVNSINSFDEWMQDEIMLASEKASMAYETFSLLAARWGMHKDRIRNFGHCSDAIRQCWGISEKKSSLYARYIIGYLEDKQEAKVIELPQACRYCRNCYVSKIGDTHYCMEMHDFLSEEHVESYPPAKCPLRGIIL